MTLLRIVPDRCAASRVFSCDVIGLEAVTGSRSSTRSPTNGGVRRFFVRDPDGPVVNVLSHAG